jgi:hypothetical protein
MMLTNWKEKIAKNPFIKSSQARFVLFCIIGKFRFETDTWMHVRISPGSEFTFAKGGIRNDG